MGIERISLGDLATGVYQFGVVTGLRFEELNLHDAGAEPYKRNNEQGVKEFKPAYRMGVYMLVMVLHCAIT